MTSDVTEPAEICVCGMQKVADSQIQLHEMDSDLSSKCIESLSV